MLYGVDVSSYQGVGEIPAGVDFVIARATYGVSPDKRAHEHIERARSLGAAVGLYHFFLPTKSVAAQVDAFERVAERCGLTVGDMPPWVDVEAYPAGGGRWVQPAPEWCAQLDALFAEMTRRWGGCGVYLTNADWLRLGRPATVVDRPLWVAHWIGERAPASPGGRPWVLHQYRVGPYVRGAAHVIGQHDDAGAIDHDRALLLPRISAAHTRPGRVAGDPPMIDLYGAALDGVRMERDQLAADYAPDVSPFGRGNGGGVV